MLPEAPNLSKENHMEHKHTDILMRIVLVAAFLASLGCFWASWRMSRQLDDVQVTLNAVSGGQDVISRDFNEIRGYMSSFDRRLPE